MIVIVLMEAGLKLNVEFNEHSTRSGYFSLIAPVTRPRDHYHQTSPALTWIYPDPSDGTKISKTLDQWCGHLKCLGHLIQSF